MTGIFAGTHMYFLQIQNFSYFKEDDPVGAMILLIGIGAVILISLIISLVRRGINVSGTSGRGSSASNPRRFNVFTLHRIASSYGLDREQTKLLEFVFRNDAVADPERALRNPTLLDRHFKRAYKTIERTADNEEELQQQTARLFSLRNLIDSIPAKSTPPSVNQITENSTVVISDGKESYSVRVIATKGDNLAVEVPRNNLGTPIQVARGAKISLSYFTKASKAFSFDVRVIGTVSSPQGPCLQLVHIGNAKALVQRRFRRKEIYSACAFFFVYADNSKEGRKKTSKLVVDSRRFTGTILDLSIGGCSIKTSAPVQVGSRLKIDIDYTDASMISVLGPVLRSNRSGAAGTVIHVKFLKVPRRAFNNINAVVYGYDGD